MRVVWSTPALSDIEGIEDHVGKDSPSAAYRLTAMLMDRTEQLLAEHPMIGRLGRVTGTRELVVAGTAYIVVYEVHEDVEILAVVHGAREWPVQFP